MKIIIENAGDNYIYICRISDDQTIVIDPSSPAPTINALKQNKLKLTAILVTHNHFDHTAGIDQLRKNYGCRVIYPQETTEKLSVGNLDIEVIKTPGHTPDSVCYFLPKMQSQNEQPILWTGDTLFTGGCGRAPAYEMKTLYQSLSAIAELPHETLIYCGHEYTLENYQFAVTILPKDENFNSALLRAKQATGNKRPTVPSTIAEEKKSNIFLRAGDPAVKKALKMMNQPDWKVFAELRKRKNNF